VVSGKIVGWAFLTSNYPLSLLWRCNVQNLFAFGWTSFLATRLARNNVGNNFTLLFFGLFLWKVAVDEVAIFVEGANIVVPILMVLLRMLVTLYWVY
jgi:hypothetical protein